MSAIVLDSLSKKYGNVPIINDFSLTIKENSFTTLVGPSGCGKTTLLRMIAGLEKIDYGTIEIDGAVVNNYPPNARNIAMVFQSYALYPHMTVFDNMAFGLKLEKHSKAEVSKRVLEAARILQLEELLKRKPKQLSGGQKQRVAIGRAITRKPKVFLFDEPLSNLDASLRVQMRLELAKLHQTIDATMVYVTHDQTEAMTLSDEIIVLNNGYLSQKGTPLDLYKKPNNLFVAGFIGSPKMNLCPAEVVSQSEKTTKIKIFEMGITLNIPKGTQKIHSGKSVILGFRPKDLCLSNEKEADITSKVILAEKLGSNTFLYLENSGEPFCVETDGESDKKVGQSIALKFKLNKVHLFDPETQKVFV